MVRLFDIKIVDAQDPDLVHEPQGPVQVSITLPGLDLSEYANVDVLHFGAPRSRNAKSFIKAAAASVSADAVESQVNGDTLTFTTGSFSVYAVIAHEGGEIVTPRIVFHYINYDHSINYHGGVMTYSAEPYNFLDNSGEYLATQIIKSGESLDEVPTPPVYNQQYFNGWYVVDLVRDQSSFNTTSRRFTGQISYTIPNNPTRQTFDQGITVSMGAEDATGIPLTWTMNGQTYTQYADKEGCAHVYLAPLYANFNYVNFYDYDRNLISRKLLVLDSNGFSSMLVSDMEATSPIETNHYFMGWSSEPYQSGNENPQTAANTIPLYKDGYKQTVYITLYGTTNYSGTLQVYYGDQSYDSTSELSNGTPFGTYNTSSTGGDVNFYAEYENAHWLRFIAGESGWGALYVPADYLVGNDAATSLRTTTRTGYQFGGWYTGYQDSNGTIWYYEKVTDGSGNVLTTGGDKTLIAYDEDPDSNDSNNITVTNYQGGTSSIDYTSTGTVSSTGLQMTADSYLYAKWDSNDTATYKVIIWQQKVTDSANQANKTYGFVNAYTETAQATRLLTLPADSQYLTRNVYGFHLDHYDQNVFIDPQGTSVVNVYYDRDVHTLHFQVNSGATFGWTEAGDDEGTQYGLVNGAYTQLTRVEDGTSHDYTYTPAYISSTETLETMWGYVNGSYVQLTRSPIYQDVSTQVPVYTLTSTLTAGKNYLIVSTNSTGSGYALGHSGATIARDGVTVRAGSSETNNLNYIRSDDVDDTSVWTVANGSGNNYTLRNNEYYLRFADNGYWGVNASSTATTYREWLWNSNSNYLRDSYNERFLQYYNNNFSIRTTQTSVYLYANDGYYLTETTSTLTGYAYYYNGQRYYGTRYVPNSAALPYTGTRYTDNTLTTPTTANGSGLYGTGPNGEAYALTYTTGPKYKWTYVDSNSDTQTYTGTRYKQTPGGNSNNWHDIYTITAVYGHDISANFPIQGWNGITYNQGQRWMPDPQTQTGSIFNDVIVYIDTMPNEDRTFHLNTANYTTKTLNYYVEALPGGTVNKTYQGVDYTLYTTVRSNINFVQKNLDFIDIIGFTQSTSDPAFGDAADARLATSVTNVDFYYTRNSYTLTFATNYPGDAQFTGTTASTNFDLPGGVLYQQPLTTAQHAAPTFTAPDHYIFDGWYEDASGTTPFNWNQTMPAANKVVYARWYPVYYRILIDPNGGVLAGNGNQNQSTYFWLQYGQTIGQYTTTRDYIEATAAEIASLGNSGTYYYRYVTPTINANGTVAEHSKWNPWPNVLLWKSDLDSDKDAEGIRPSYYRLAEYIKVEDYHTANDTFYKHLLSSGLTAAQAAAWDAHYVDTAKKYRPVTDNDPNWVLVGWYKNGNPYDFTTAVTTDVKLTAVWRQAGNYFLHYNPTMEISGVSGTLTGAAYDPVDPSENGSTGYIDKATTHAATAPDHITDPSGDNNTYVFEGWRVVDASGNPLDENGHVMNEAEFGANAAQYLFQPGDEITVRSEQAHLENGKHIIELRAYYKRIEDSARHPKTVQVILDANDAYNGYIDPSAATWPTWGNPGNAAVNTTTELSQSRPTQIAFGDAEENQAIHLANYIDFFKHEKGDFLLGFDPQPDPERCANGANGPYIPLYAADAVIGIDDPTATNTLYAIWEPMVYVTFVNYTGAPVTVSLDTLTDVFPIQAAIVNNATQIYDRTKITTMDSVTVAAGKTLRIVIPKGMEPNTDPEQGRTLTLTIHNSHIGYKMSGTKQVGNEAATQLFGGTATSAALENGEHKQDAQALVRDYTGIIYTLTEEPLPYAFFDPNGGTWQDSGHTATNENMWDAATKPDGRVFLETTEQGSTQYKIKLSQFMQPAVDPTAPSGKKFLGWTTDENVGRFVRVNGDFSLTAAQLTTLRDGATSGSADYLMYDALLALIEEYKAAAGVSEVRNLLEVLENYSLWNFSNAPAGTTYYAVYAKTATVNYHLMLAGGSYNHSWGLGNLASTTGPEGTVYTRKPVNESTDSNRSHYVWYCEVVKGSSVVQPTAPTYYNNGNYTFLYWLKDDTSHTSGSTVPSAVTTAFPFADPVTEDTVDLYTSWADLNYTTMRVIKVVNGAMSSTRDTFNLSYDITTYKYTYVGSQVSRAEYGTPDSTGFTLLGTTNAPGTVNQNYRDIRLYYWTDSDGALYSQAVEIREDNLSTSGYELVITDADTLAPNGSGRTSVGSTNGASSLVYVNNESGANYYRYYPVSNRYVESGQAYYISYAGEKESKPIWRLQKGSYNLYFWNNTWYTNYQCTTAATSSQKPNSTQTVTFTNSKNAKVRFVKKDKNDFDRLDGATFTISKINDSGSGSPTSQVLTFNTGYVRTASESVGRNGRFILNAGQTIPAASPIQMDTDHNELVFTQTGTYRLTETTAPEGYSLPSALANGHALHGVNYVDIVVSATGITISGGNTNIASGMLLSQLNVGEVHSDNEFAVVVRNSPKIVYFKLQKVDTTGDPILTGIPENNLATSGLATFTAFGTATASGVWVSLGSFSTTGAEAYTDVKEVPYGSYTVTETLAPVGYRTADATHLAITDDGSGNPVLTATGGNVYGTVTGAGTEADPFIVKIQDEEIGYDLKLSKAVVNEPGDGVERVYSVTITARGDTVAKVARKTYNVVKVDASNNSTNASVTFSVEGVATVTIKKDETVTLRSLPRGSYVVSEATMATVEGTVNSVPFATAIVVTEPASGHTLTSTPTNTTSPFTLSNPVQAAITNTFGHTLTITKNVDGGLASVTDRFTLVIIGDAITHYTYTGSRSDDGGTTYTPMNFAATPTTGSTPGSIEFTTRNNNPVNGGPITGNTVIVINGILDGAYTLTETIPDQSGYILTAEVDHVNRVVTNHAFSVTVSNRDVEVVMTNTCNAVSPTGLTHAYAPFILMVAAGMALALIVTVGCRRRREEA